MRLLKHINEVGYEKSSRSVPIDLAKGIELIKKECSSALKSFRSGHKVFRGLDMTSPIAFVQPSKHVRVSANTINLYTIILDNIKSWSSYPKRSQSIICSNSYGGATGYGDVYVVLPKDGFKFGVCPSHDIWDSFVGIASLSTFNQSFVAFLSDIDIRIKWGSFKTLKDLQDVCDIVDKRYASGVDMNMYMPGFMKGYSGDLLKHLERLFSPKRSGFKMVSNIDNLPKEEREIWTDSDCYLMRHDNIGMLS